MPDNRLRQLMQNLFDKHSEFHKEFAKGNRWIEKGKERSEIVIARNQFFDALNHLFVAKFDPLRKAFLRNTNGSIDEVIDFLEIDIPAFRCGYEKEWYLGKLKSVSLNQNQRDRLKNIAIELASKPHYRRELRDWGRLMIVLADDPFVINLRTLSDSEDHFVQQNSRRMLKTVLENRRDLMCKESIKYEPPIQQR